MAVFVGVIALMAKCTLTNASLKRDKKEHKLIRQ
jgi:hypothetical protein